MASRIPKSKQWELDFGSHDIKEDVYRPLCYALAHRLQNNEVNLRVLKLVDSKRIVDSVELVPLIQNHSMTPFARMSAFLDNFANKDAATILDLLIILCNLKDMPNLSSDIRNLINEQFPNSVRPK